MGKAWAEDGDGWEAAQSLPAAMSTLHLSVLSLDWPLSPMRASTVARAYTVKTGCKR